VLCPFAREPGRRFGLVNAALLDQTVDQKRSEVRDPTELEPRAAA
jgi:hypothetical protein